MQEKNTSPSGQPKKSSNKKGRSKKHEPKGMTILHEDKDILVVDKMGGLLTVGTDREKEKTAHYILNDYVRKGNIRSRNRVYIVHRLDRETSGVLIFAKSEKMKQLLQETWQSFSKKYMAVVHGKFAEKEGEITSYLAANKANRMYSVKEESKGKYSKTGYKVIKSNGRLSLLEVTLHTGRKNQIRVHFAEKQHPVVGDKMYGEVKKGGQQLALHAASLEIVHPFTKKTMVFEATVPSFFEALIKKR